MRQARLKEYNPSGECVAITTLTAESLDQAVLACVKQGYQSGKDFLVVEPQGEDLRMYWRGAGGFDWVRSLGEARILEMVRRKILKEHWS